MLANCEPQLWNHHHNNNNNHYHQQQQQHSYYSGGFSGGGGGYSSSNIINNYSLPTANSGVVGANNNNNNNFFNQNHFTDYIACSRNEIDALITNQQPNNEPHGFRIKIQANPDKYVPNEMYTIVLQGDQNRLSKYSGPGGSMVYGHPSSSSSSTSSGGNSQRFTEFVLYVVPKDFLSSQSSPSLSSSSSVSPSLTSTQQRSLFDVGSFQPQVYTDSLVKLSKDCPNAVTHTSPVPKNEISVMWLAPQQGSGCIVFKAIVAESKDKWYHEDGGLTKVLCEEEADTIADAESEIVDECCACDEAKYEVTFEGYWSKYTHPKDFPANAWQTHFSDIIGASHSSDFRIWEYGGYASEGVKQVAESGITKKLESELKAESSKIRTIIKARGLWYPNLNGKTFAVFRVDNRHHLMSLLSMLGPSPDWFIGVSALELCLKNCSWVADKSINLYLWDAGTDSGVTYLSRDLPTIPQERIRRITSTSPNLPESPFYDPSGAPMKPFARLTISRQRIYEKVCGDDDNRFSISDFDDDDNRSADCSVTEWTVFGPCSVACGHGIRKRTRNYMNEKRAKEVGCNMKLIETEECGAKCVNNVSCETTAWSEWTSCNVTCGRGYRKRNRKFLHRLARSLCHNVELEQRESCVGTSSNCGHQNQHQSSSSSSSLSTTLTGSSTGHNNYDQEIIEPHCAVTNWSEWTPCSVECGKGIKYRNRLYINAYKSKNVCNVKLIQSIDCFNKACMTLNNDAQHVCSLPKEVGPCRGYFPRYYYDSSKGACLQFIYRGCRGNHNNFDRLQDCKEKCENHFKGMIDENIRPNSNQMYNQYNHSMTSPLIGDDQNLVIDCVVTLWSEWSQCTKPCGKARKERRREIKLNPQNGGRKCPKLVQRRKCKENPPCVSDSRNNYQQKKNGHNYHHHHHHHQQQPYGYHHQTSSSTQQQQQQQSRPKNTQDYPQPY
uniref:Spondin-1 n=1 Tax=Dermatophagoides pteronyssinus TaxID=6956 RepID=A0A6P6YFW4_DERPT|nr:spondin-1-like isoform X2 [Dermatophagoides pteronyssinus]